jgi:hypothetical protein
MKAGKRIPVNFDEPEDQLLIQQIPINIKSARAQGKPSTKFRGLKLEIKGLPAVCRIPAGWSVGDQYGRSTATLHHYEPGHSRLRCIQSRNL